MENLEKRKKQIRFDEIKSTVRKVEAVIELAVLAAVYPFRTADILKMGAVARKAPAVMEGPDHPPLRALQIFEKILYVQVIAVHIVEVHDIRIEALYLVDQIKG